MNKAVRFAVMARQIWLASREHDVSVWWNLHNGELCILRQDGIAQDLTQFCLKSQRLTRAYVGDFNSGSRQGEIEKALRAHYDGKLVA